MSEEALFRREGNLTAALDFGIGVFLHVEDLAHHLVSVVYCGPVEQSNLLLVYSKQDPLLLLALFIDDSLRFDQILLRRRTVLEPELIGETLAALTGSHLQPEEVTRLFGLEFATECLVYEGSTSQKLEVKLSSLLISDAMQCDRNVSHDFGLSLAARKCWTDLVMFICRAVTKQCELTYEIYGSAILSQEQIVFEIQKLNNFAYIMEPQRNKNGLVSNSEGTQDKVGREGEDNTQNQQIFTFEAQQPRQIRKVGSDQQAQDARLEESEPTQPNNQQKNNQAAEQPLQKWFGINKRLYRHPQDKTAIPVKTGIEDNLLPQNPHFQNYKQQQYQMYEPKPFILEQAIKRDIQIICMMTTLMKRIVYDLYDVPAPTEGLNPKDYDVDVMPYYLPESETDTTLVFESRFETGNLRRAIQLFEYEYQLILNTDWSTNSHTQWFYFSVANTRKDVEYKFSIINLMKPDSLYNSGMKPLFYSERLAREKKCGWFRDGYDICYYQNNLKRKNGDFYYNLNFSVKLPYDHDTVYITHCYPYTYSQLQSYLNEIERDPKRKHLVQRKTVCQTIAGNNCDCVIISDFNNGKEKKGVFLTSRVHPGETMASYIIEYIIEFLLSNSSIAKILRENFLFKIVPMLNIDGVIIGNYRCDLAQVDLNRQWIDPNKKIHPTIYHTKQMIKRMKQERELLVYCDFHGHSRKKNCFMYGCAKDNSKKQQVFPAIMRTNCNTFSFKDSSFLIQKDREGASRIALWKQLNIVNCFTMEVSFCGADAGRFEYKHFNLDSYKAMAQAFCLTIFDLYEPEQTKVKQVTYDLEQNLLKYQKFQADDSGGDDSDYSVQGDNKPKEESKGEKQASKNQIVIKKKLPANNLPANKKKK